MNILGSNSALGNNACLSADKNCVNLGTPRVSLGGPSASSSRIPSVSLKQQLKDLPEDGNSEILFIRPVPMVESSS